MVGRRNENIEICWPLNLRLENAYPAGSVRATAPSTLLTVMIALFLTQRGKFDPFPTVSCNRDVKCTVVKELGTGMIPNARSGGVRLSPGENAMAITQSTGYIEIRAMTMRKACFRTAAPAFFTDLVETERAIRHHSW
jgi:hypothetical protein